MSLAWVAEPSKLCGDAFQASGATFDHSGSLLDSARSARLGILVCQNAVDISDYFNLKCWQLRRSIWKNFASCFEACTETARPTGARKQLADCTIREHIAGLPTGNRLTT